MFLILFVVVNFGELEQHERQHRQIFGFYGIESETTYDWMNFMGVTRVTGNATPSRDAYLQLVDEQAKIEIDGYNHGVTIITIMLSAYVIGMAVIMSSEKEPRQEKVMNICEECRR